LDRRAVLIPFLFLLLLLSLAVVFNANLAEVSGAKDKTPPTGSILINSGDAYTNSTSVSLTLTADDPESGVKEVRYSNNDVWGKWEKFSATKSWMLLSGDGTKTVYYQIKNNDNLVSITYSDTIILSTEPTPAPTPTPEPTPAPTPAPTFTPDAASTPTNTSAPSLSPSPSPSNQSPLSQNQSAELARTEQAKLIGVAIVLFMGGGLIYLSLKREE
jgi:hypothetical protein